MRIEDRFDTDIDDVWSALTDPARLAYWYGTVDGDLFVGGEYHARLFASGWVVSWRRASPGSASRCTTSRMRTTPASRSSKRR